MERSNSPLPFTPFHRHELRTGLRLRVFRREITAEQRKLAFAEVESDLADEILVHTAIPWTDVFRHAEELSEQHTESLGVRSFDLMHVAMARTLEAKEFLTFDNRQASLAKAAGLRVKPA
jgi:predicted nucleic acid-binding protein